MFLRLLRTSLTCCSALIFGLSAAAQCDDPLTFDPPLSDATVECLSDLPSACDETQGANRGQVFCGLAEDVQSRTVCEGTTAEGDGEDGAIVLFAVDGDPLDNRYFIPTDAGISLVQFENGVAVVSGQVADVDDPNAILDVNIFYENGMSGADWAGSFKTDMSCAITTDVTDSWMIYIMNSGLSYLTGAGTLEGTTLQLHHSPASETFGFQIGEMANDRNCNYGAGGWFSYSGMINGVEIMGGQGDVLLDLNCNEEQNNACGEDESTVTLFYVAYDEACGDVLIGEEEYTRHDTEAPEFVDEPENISIACTEELPAVPTVTATDNCEDSDASGPSVSYSGQTPPYDQVCTGTYKVDRTWIAEDCSGNQTAYTQTISVYDDVAPVIIAGSDYEAQCDGSGNLVELNAWLDNNGGATATDNCGTVTWTNNFTALSDDCGATGSATVTFTATDDCDNASSTTATFTIVDTTNPSMDTASSDQTVECDGSGNTAALNAWLASNGGASASDACSNVTWSNNFTALSDDCGATGSVTVTFTATDDCDNATSTTATFTIEDTLDPSMDTAASDQTVECDGNLNQEEFFFWLTTNGGAMASDNCSDVVWTNDFVVTDEGEIIGAIPGCGEHTGSITVTFTATDDCGNASETSATFTIEDTTNPSMDTASSDQTVECDGAGNTAALNAWLASNGGATASDVCSGVTWSNNFTALSDDCGATGSATVTFTATDDCDNSTSTTSTFTIEDTTNPSMDTASSDQTVECDGAGNTAALNAWLASNGGASASDACSNVTWSNNFTALSDDCGATGSATVTFTATDDCDNATSTTATFTIEDTTNPSMDTASSDQTVECDGSGNTAALNAWLASNGGASASDVCGGVTWSNNFTALSDDCGATGSATVTFTATDDCDNATSTTATFTIEDTTNPVWNGYDVYVYAACEDLLNPENPTQVPLSADDACSGVTYSISAYQLSGGCPGTWMRVWTATDDCGNSSVEAEQYVQLYDNVNPVPVVVCPDDYTVYADGLCISDTEPEAAGEATATATDNCDDDVTVVVTYSDGDITETCDGAYYFTRTWTATATDDCENVETDSCDQLITVLDNTSPVISGGGDETVECDGSGNEDALMAWLNSNGGATATDNCSEVTWSNNYIDCDGGLGMFTTYNQGQWGSATGGVASDLMDDDFDVVFADGLRVGCEDGYELLFTSAASVDNYLPCTGGASDLVLTHGGADPTEDTEDPTCWDNALVSHLLTAKLNVAFDAANSDFGSSDVELGDLIAVEGPFYGMSINDIIAISDGVLGDCRDDYTPQECRVALRAFNKNYLNGDTDRGFSYIAGCMTDDCAATGSAVVTFTATDQCNNSSEITLTFTIEDTTAPTIAGDIEQNIACDAWVCDADALEELGLFSVTEDCGEYTLDITCAEGSGGCVQPIPDYTITIVATDECGNESDAFMQFVTLVDDVAPTIDMEASDQTVECDGNLNQEEFFFWLTTNGGAMASDNCSDVVWTNDFVVTDEGEIIGAVPGCGEHTGSITVTFTATDDCGNASETSATFTIEDTTNPSMDTASSDQTVECDGAGNTAALNAWLASNGGASASDVCSGVTWSNNFTALSDDCGATGSATVTFTATDDCDNSTSTTATFTIEDTTNPSMDTASSDETVECDGAGNTAALNAWLASNGGASASDACSNVTWSNNFTALSDDCGATGSATVTFTATDDCDNATSTTATFTIEDTTNPSMDTASSDQTVECDGSGNTAALNAWLASNGGASASDACSNVTWSNNFTALSDDCGATGSVTVTFTATDDCDNATSTTATFTIEDTLDPSMDTAASDQTVECDGAGNIDQFTAWLLSNGGASASDDCSSVTWTNDFVITAEGEIVNAVLDCGLFTGSLLVTFTATDECGNDTETSATFTIEDTTNPSMDTASSDQTVECDGAGNTAALNAWLASNGGASASDVCSGVTWSNNFTALSDDCGATGSATVTFTATDACNNATSTTSTFTIEDTTNPSMDTASSDQTVECDGAGNTAALNAWLASNGGASASDACSNVTWSNNFTALSDDCGATGSATVTFTATDDCDNATSTTATFTIEDTTNPSMDTASSDQTVECDGSGNTAALNAWLASNGGASASDACSNVTWSNNFTALSDDCGATGSATVTFTATDDCDNATSTTATFTIEDTAAPSASADPVVAVPCDEYNAETAYGNFTASDACGGVTVTIFDLPGSGVCAGSFSRTYTIVDDCGNDVSIMQTINLTDDVPPTFDIACPEDVDLVANADCFADTSVETHGSATFSNEADNCDPVVEMNVSSNDVIVDGCEGSYTISRTWTITGTDHCDNVTTKTCVQTITVSDNTNPTITAEALDYTAECDGNLNQEEFFFWLTTNGGAMASDNCSDVVWTNDFVVTDEGEIIGAVPGCSEHTGSITVTFTATDDCGNASETSATFTIEDTTPPSLSIEGPANQNLDQNATCNVDTSVEALGNVVASADDDCDSASIEITHEDGMATYTCAGDDEALEGSYTFVRTFTVTATDDCGLQTTDTYEQTITVTDGIAPQFTETCGLSNGDVQNVCCEDLSGTVTIPDACETAASDNCDSDVAIAYGETYVGDYAPTEDVMSFCLSTTPAAYADGEACNGLDPHAFSLFNFDGEPRVDFTSVGSGLVSQMNDGTWMLQQELSNAAGTGMLTLTVTYGAASSWDDWFVPGQTNYKRDCGVLVDDHENWDYRILESGSVTGSGDYDGLNLSLSHAPANEYYAFQIGLGANNQNDNYGYSGWIMASGTYMDDAVFFSGDLFGDLDCCLPWSIDREYTASDDCGNATEFAYSISVNGDDCSDDDGALVSGGQDEDHTPGIIGGAGDVLTGKSPIRVTNLQPNPTNDLSLLGFTVTQNMRLRVDMYTMDGILVSELYDGVASPNVNHTLDIEASALESGMYQIRLSSSQYLVVKKLLVTE